MPRDDAPTPAVSIVQLTKVFQTPFKKDGVVAVRDVSLAVQPGEVYGLIGPNGSGKSTTMKAVLGLVKPSAGKCAVFGTDSRHVTSRSDIGYLPENPYFYRHLTGSETLAFYGKLSGLSRGEIKTRTGELLALTGLEHARDRRLGGYSKGMLQRIGLGTALVQHPRLVVLDEPTAGIDPAGSRQIRDLILRLKEENITVLLCSHLLEQVQEVCDRIGIMSDGHLVREGRVADLVSVSNQTEIVLENAPPDLVAEIEAAVARRSADGVKVVTVGHPNTTLEHLFLEATSSPTLPAGGEVRRDDGGRPSPGRNQNRNPNRNQDAE